MPKNKQNQDYRVQSQKVYTFSFLFFLQWISAAILIMHLLNQYIIRPLYFIVIFVNVNI